VTTASRFRVFISAVSSEFETARGEIASDLRSRGIEVKFQEDFRQEADADTTLSKLQNYIRGCHAVVCVIGRRSGFVPPPAAAEPFQHIRPDGLKPPSYTQWELLFARHYHKRLSIYVADPKYEPDRPEPGDASDPELQARFVHYLFDELGLDRTGFSTTDQLCRRVLREEWPQVRGHKPILLPYASLSELFKGREGVLEDLHQSLKGAGKATAIVGKAIHGLGGVGKTRLAVEYAWRHVDDYDAIFLISAETPEILRQNLAGLTDGEVLNLPEQKSPDESARVVAALRWLNENPDWLLILDSLDTREAAAAGEDVLAKVRGGHVLFTSRLSQWGGGIASMELDVLDRDAAARFVLERTEGRRRETETDEADATKLAGELDGLALALEQAGAYVSRRRLALADYLDLWRSHLTDVQGWHDPRIMKYPRSVAVTWETTLAQLDAGATGLLRLLSWFAPEALPLFVLEGEAADAVWQTAAELVCTEESISDRPEGDVLDALSTLADFSMVVWDAELQTVSVHRVVQEIMRSRLPDSSRTDWLRASLAMLDAVLLGDPQDVRTWASWDPLRPHVALMAALADEAAIARPTARLMGELGRLLLNKALHAEAEPLLRRALEIDEASYGPDHPEVAIRLNNLAGLLQATNRLAEAEPLMRRALEIDEASYGPDHPEVAIRLNNLAQLLQTTNRLEEAEPLSRRHVKIFLAFQQRTGQEHRHAQLAFANYAGLLQAMGRTDDESRAAIEDLLAEGS
jgi:tetratricopeptide (TPR) repeat protein